MCDGTGCVMGHSVLVARGVLVADVLAKDVLWHRMHMPWDALEPS